MISTPDRERAVRLIKETTAQRPQQGASTHCAAGPNQVWCWDITWLPGPAKGIFYYLYLILDMYSRKIVGWEVHEGESSELASQLVTKAYLREGIAGMPLVLLSDNGPVVAEHPFEPSCIWQCCAGSNTTRS